MKKASVLIKLVLVVVITIVLFEVPTAIAQGSLVQQWIARFNGTGNGIDSASSIAIDNSGNVYVTGKSFGTGTGYDYATIKYNSSGNQVWLARYDGTGHGNDTANTIVVDSAGNVYVTGKSTNTVNKYDYVTIKYNNSGVQQWLATYDGPSNNDDIANALVVDSSGNVYVTGESMGLNTDTDYTTIKYDSSGNQIWVARYDGEGTQEDTANALLVDSSGNVYVTGKSMNASLNFDYATIKYDSSGKQVWLAKYDGFANNDDKASSIAVDISGNVYVTGESQGIEHFNYVTIKYDNNGSQQWAATYDGEQGDSFATAIALDSSGNAHVTGKSVGNGTGYDYATIKYDSGGNQVWLARYNGTGNGEDSSNSIVLDNSANVYVTGNSTGSGSGSDYATIKYDSSGNQIWLARYNGTGNGSDTTSAIAVDNSGNVYITGDSTGSGTSSDYATIKYSTPSTQTPPPPALQTPPPPAPPPSYSSPSLPAISQQLLTSAASIVVTNLNVQPRLAQATQPVTIYANIANRGDDSGSYTATLKINGQIEETRTGRVGGRAAVPLKFEVLKDKPGTYAVDINGQQSSFTIVDDGGNKFSATAITMDWPMIALVLCGVGIIIVLGLVLRRRFSDY